MRLDRMTWPEVAAYLEGARGVLLPVGSIEQHGPIGPIGTDALVAEAVAGAAAARVGAVVAPVLAYTPAPFNMGFPGTVSVSADLFAALAGEVCGALAAHGFTRIYVLNGHGANLEPLGRVSVAAELRVVSWWGFAEVDALRRALYGDWEGMHATPSEIAIAQHLTGVVHAGAEDPPERLSEAYIRAHAGDRHGEAAAHRARFPDGRVGSHSALATPEAGARLFEAAVAAVAADYVSFVSA